MLILDYLSYFTHSLQYKIKIITDKKCKINWSLKRDSADNLIKKRLLKIYTYYYLYI